MDTPKRKSYKIGNNHSPVYISEDSAAFVKTWRHHIGTHKARNVFVLLDENVEKSFPDILNLFFNEANSKLHVKRMPGGEKLKTWNHASEICDELSALKADRSWVMVSIGGGTLSDLAGFTASIYKRGISCVFLPTSLMAMIDASIGGKNALNQGILKNQIGTYYFSEFIFVYPPFLQSLDKSELKSGYAELIKHALLHSSKSLWNKILKQGIGVLPDMKMLADAIRVKMKIVQQDPFEKHQRLFLNFGHSFGHAIESYYNDSGQRITHGEAVAMGMQFALFLSAELEFISVETANSFRMYIHKEFPFPKNLKFNDFLPYLHHDKKILHGQHRIILFKGFGSFTVEYLDIKKLEETYDLFIKGIA